MASSNKDEALYFIHLHETFSSGLAARLGSSAFFVLCAYKTHCNWKTGRAYPGVRSLMRETGLASATVQLAIKILTQEGLLIYRGISDKRTSIYEIREIVQLKKGGRLVATAAISYRAASLRKTLLALHESVKSGATLPTDLPIICLQPGLTLDSKGRIIVMQDDPPPASSELRTDGREGYERAMRDLRLRRKGRLAVSESDT